MKEFKKNKHTFLLMAFLLIGMFFLCLFAVPTRAHEKIAKVDIDYLIKSLIKEIAKEEGNENDLKAKTKEALGKLDLVVKNFAAQRKAVILHSKAVIAGADDVTHEIEKQLQGG